MANEKGSGHALVRRVRIALMILGPAALLAGGLWWYFSHRGYVSTDDAFVEGNIVQVSPQVSGRVVSVPVRENEAVHQGQVLLRLDAAPYEAKVKVAQAKLAMVRDDVKALRAQYLALTAQIKGAEAKVAYLRREVKRQGPLARKNVVTNARLDEVTTQLARSKQGVSELEARRDQVLARLGGNPGQPVADNADYQRALATLDEAQLDLSYTVVRAPAAGVVTEVNVRPGNVLRAGSPAFPLVESGSLWVKANFKETALTDMRPGQPVRVTVDSYPGHTWKGHVASISPGSGAIFSLLPPQNATGNWVKVTQRIPVRIALDDWRTGPVLRAGMSAEVSVHVGGS